MATRGTTQRLGEAAALPMRELPTWLRPRERLQSLGPQALQDHELLAVILGSGRRQRSVLQVAADLLGPGGNLEALAVKPAECLASHPGLGRVGASRVVALVELSRRMARARSRAGVPLTSAKMVYELFRGRTVGDCRERVVVLLLDARRRLLAERCVSIGSLGSSLIHPREVFRPALEVVSSSLILVHNHPSGDPTPSVEDHQVTARLFEAGLLLGVPLLDHVVVAADGYRSFREEGWLEAGNVAEKR